MADFLVKEEDGTSHILLENSDSFLLEESSPHERSGAGIAGATLVVPPVPLLQGGTWRVGVITVPSSTGAMSVTGLGATPRAVFFYGTNWLTEDAIITSSAAALFRGMVAPKWDDPGTLLQSFSSLAPAGDAFSQGTASAIACLDSSGGSGGRYDATVTSLDADGFSLNWNSVTAGGYKVVYVALMGTGNAVGWQGNFTGASFSPGFKAGASMLHASDPGPVASSTSNTANAFASASYPGTSQLLWKASGSAHWVYPTSPSGQYINELSSGQPPQTLAVPGAHGFFAFLVPSDLTAYPTGTGLTDFIAGGDPYNGGMVLVWDDEDNEAGIDRTPASSVGGTETVSGLPFAPGLLLSYNISNEPSQFSTGGRGAVGFSIVTPDFQWSATIHGFSSGYASQGAYQTFNRGFVDVVDGGAGDIHAGTVELTSDGFVLTTVENDIAPATTMWHAFGHPDRITSWIPQIYRRQT